MIRKGISLFVVSLLIGVCSCHENVATNPSPENVENTFQQLLEEAINTSFESVPGVSMTVVAPSLDINWTGAAGHDSKKKDQELNADQPFRIASVTKTFVATAILRLHEQGKLSIDDPISKYISVEHIQLIKSGGYSPDSITLRHCLNHTSGLYDYALGGNAFIELAVKSPNRRWTRTDQIQLAMESGKRNGFPGERYDYGDTAYILLGETVEFFKDSSLAFGLRDLLKFDELKMNHTWLETLEQEPEGLKDFVHRYFRGNDLTDWDPSIDLYGGGGLVSTTEDLAVFMYSLFNQKVYDQSETLNLMLEKPTYAASYIPEEDDRSKDYRQGVWEINIYGEKGYMHGGIWGTVLLYIPTYDCAIAINYTHGRRDRLTKKVALVVKNIYDQK